MKKLCIYSLIVLCLLAIIACEPIPVETEDKLAWIDADGIPHVVPVPAQFDSLRAMRALPDGNLLFLSNDFYIYHTASNTVTRIKTPDLIIPNEGSTFCLNREGDAIFYCTEGKIWRKNLLSLAEECLVDSAGATYFSPFASPDGRYLAFLRKNHQSNWLWQGYPLYLDLQTKEVHSLASGDEFLDSIVTDCWIDHFRSLYMFSTQVGYGDYHLNSMNMDGTGRAVTTEMVRKGALTADGRYLLPRPDVGGSSAMGLYYRDNLSLFWTKLEDASNFSIGFTGSLIYYYNEQRVYRHNLSTGEKQLLIDKNIVSGRKIHFVTMITPFRDDSGIFAVIALKLKTGKILDD